MKMKNQGNKTLSQSPFNVVVMFKFLVFAS